MIKSLSIFFVLLSACTVSICQVQLNQFKITSSHTSFPDTGRMKGHLYNDVLYNTADHYSDSSVIIITPKNFIAKKKVDMIFWFHGWNNNIDSALVRYGLSRQFAESGTNAVLVLAETAKDAPDSYGGKLEQKNTFSKLVADVLQKLVSMHVISENDNIGNVILAGHSGAYRVMANILQNGNVPVNEVILFDALYADTGKFLTWLIDGNDHRFINLYTDNGGTYDETKDMMRQIKNLNVPADSLEETDITPAILQNNKIIFIHTTHEHNDIIQHPDNFKLFIENTPVLKKLR
ncbi:MAG TPA: hypothetical protein VNS50_09135 [Ginsengibacter sp.]|nr:hypothetical protein [Ginsengibacter sp.]